MRVFTHGWHLAIPACVLASMVFLDVALLRLRCPMAAGFTEKRNLSPVIEHRNAFENENQPDS